MPYPRPASTPCMAQWGYGRAPSFVAGSASEGSVSAPVGARPWGSRWARVPCFRDRPPPPGGGGGWGCRPAGVKGTRTDLASTVARVRARAAGQCAQRVSRRCIRHMGIARCRGGSPWGMDRPRYRDEVGIVRTAEDFFCGTCPACGRCVGTSVFAEEVRSHRITVHVHAAADPAARRAPDAGSPGSGRIDCAR